MPRIEYIPNDTTEPADLVGPIRARRGGTLLNLDRQLLHSPPLARGWNSFLGAIRSELTVSARLRELAICAVAVLNEAPYELIHHAPVWLAEGGTQRQLDALAEPDLALKREDLFDAAERATLRLSIEMTRRVSVDDAVFRDLRNALANERETIEIVAVIAAYNMVSRVIVALGIDPE